MNIHAIAIKGSRSHVIKLEHVRSFEWSRDTHGGWLKEDC